MLSEEGRLLMLTTCLLLLHKLFASSFNFSALSGTRLVVDQHIVIDSSPAISQKTIFLSLIFNQTPITIDTDEYRITITKHRFRKFSERPGSDEDSKPLRAKCRPNPSHLSMIHLMNSSLLEQTLNENASIELCILVNFFSRGCPFSAKLAAVYNALPRAYPDVMVVAVDVERFSRLNTRYGVVGTPTILLFHNSKAMARYNGSEFTLDNLKSFVEKYSNLTSVAGSNIEDLDLFGPLPTKADPSIDWCLILAWIFILVCAGYAAVQSKYGKQFIEAVRRNWREANEEQ